MRHTSQRAGRRGAKAEGRPVSDRGADGTVSRDDRLAARDAQDERPLLQRILDTPSLAQVIPQLQADVLHRVIQTCGLEDCGALVALTTPAQLAAVFDLDLWHASRPGGAERLDADRFGVWLEVFMESGAAVAAQTLATVDADLAIAALAEHLRVFDAAAESVPTNGGGVADVGGYRIVATRPGPWDAIVAVLGALAKGHAEYFARIMRGCRRLSNVGFELDGLNHLLSDREQIAFDVASAREQRRERQGYVMPAEAAAFLQSARSTRLTSDAPPVDPLAQAYFRDRTAMSATVAADSGHSLSAADDEPTAFPAGGVQALVEVLIEAGVIPQPPRALLEAPRDQPASRLERLRRQMQMVHDRDPFIHARRSEELAYLVNALVAGCRVQERPLTAQEASDASVAVCNLGLEYWPAHWLHADVSGDPSGGSAQARLPDDFLVEQNLIGVFQVGWSVLHERVCLHAAEQLIGALARLPDTDPETRADLKVLRTDLTRHWKAGAPWGARDALDVLATLDLPAWAALLALIDVCPTMHAGLGAAQDSATHSVSASAFTFISETAQIESIHAYLRTLPDLLRG